MDSVHVFTKSTLYLMDVDLKRDEHELCKGDCTTLIPMHVNALINVIFSYWTYFDDPNGPLRLNVRTDVFITNLALGWCMFSEKMNICWFFYCSSAEIENRWYFPQRDKVHIPAPCPIARPGKANVQPYDYQVIFRIMCVEIQQRWVLHIWPVHYNGF